MSKNISQLLKDAVDQIQYDDFIMIVRDGCITLISYENFIKDGALGGDALCVAVRKCWEEMGSFTTPAVVEVDGDCECPVLKWHIPKGEGIRIITNAADAKKNDSIYFIQKGDDTADIIIIDNEGNKRTISGVVSVLGAESIGSGIPIYKGIEDKKIGIATLSSPNGTVLITELPDGGIGIDTPQLNTIKTFYVNANAPENGDGSITRPYRTFGEAKSAVIGTGNFLQPQYEGAKIIIQTDVYTSESIEINRVHIEIQNTSSIFYTNNNLALDSEVFHNALVAGTYGLTLGVNGEYPIYVEMTISGNGFIRRTKGGLVGRWWGSVRNPLNKGYFTSVLRLNTLDSDWIQFVEGITDETVFTEDVEYADGSLLEDSYGYPFKATTSLLPTTHILDFRYPNNAAQATVVYKGSVQIQSISQSGVLIDNGATVIQGNTGSRFSFIVDATRVSYTGSFGIPHDGYKVYLPYNNRVMMNMKHGIFSGSVDINEKSGFGHIGWGTLFRIGEDFILLNFTTKIETQWYGNEIFLMTGATNIAVVSTGEASIIKGYNIQNFIKNNTVNHIIVHMPNSTIIVKDDILIDTPSYMFSTFGTVSSINGRPYLTGLPSSDAGLLNGAMWEDSGELKIK